jgi:hypothetical protein
MEHTTTLRILGVVITIVLVFVIVVLDLTGAENLIQSTTELLLVLVSIAGTIAFQLIIWPQRFLPQPTQEPTSLPQSSETSDMVLDEQTTAVLVRLAKSEYRHTLTNQLNYIWKQVDEGWHARFLIWKNLSPVLKKLLIPYKPEYDALEDLANALDQLSDNDNKADFDALKTLCKNRFDRLKELGLVY